MGFTLQQLFIEPKRAAQNPTKQQFFDLESHRIEERGTSSYVGLTYITEFGDDPSIMAEENAREVG